MSVSSRRISPEPLLAASGALFIPLLLIPQPYLEQILDQGLMNALAAVIVFVYGLALLLMMWRIEREGAAVIPYAWCYFAVQHLAFGFGGILVTFFNQDYFYANEQGLFPYGSAALPLLRAHFVSMSVGLLAVWLALGGQKRTAGASRRNAAGVPSLLTWADARAVCLWSTAIHATAWLILPRLTIAPGALYVALLLRGPSDSMFVIWGYCWRDCRSKWILVAYTTVFAMLEALAGSRGYFLFPLLFFGFGMMISGSIPKWNSRAAIRVLPLTVLAMWSFSKSEDVRNVFSRTDVTDVQDAINRMGSLTDNSSDSINYLDGSGVPTNRMFRAGSRLFETSASDVITRTPSGVPYYGWTEDDWSVFLTGLLPLKLNSGAGYFTSEGTGVFFLRSYGWYVDPYSEINATSTSMPATQVADSWRRFGWAGVVVWFLVWPFFLAKCSRALRFRPGYLTAQIFGSALLVDIAQDYTNDITSLVDAIPRRVLLLWLYSLLLAAISKRQRKAVSSISSSPEKVVLACTRVWEGPRADGI